MGEMGEEEEVVSVGSTRGRERGREGREKGGGEREGEEREGGEREGEEREGGEREKKEREGREKGRETYM